MRKQRNPRDRFTETMRRLMRAIDDFGGIGKSWSDVRAQFFARADRKTPAALETAVFVRTRSALQLRGLVRVDGPAFTPLGEMLMRDHGRTEWRASGALGDEE